MHYCAELRAMNLTTVMRQRLPVRSESAMMKVGNRSGGIVETMDIADVSASLPRLVARLERGELDEVVITRDARPVARLVPAASTAKRLGIAQGKLALSDDLDASDDEIARLFNKE